MKAQDKAKELVEKFSNLSTVWIEEEVCYKSPQKAKIGALIAVDEIINSSPSLPILGDGGYFSEDIELSLAWWKKVRQQIELL